jgi:hypothetical protein
MKDNKRPKRSQRVSPVAIINGFENINEIRTFYEENEIPEKKEVIEQQSQKLITKEENIEPFEPKDTETEENKTEENIIENRDVDPKITRTINNFLIKLEKKL